MARVDIDESLQIYAQETNRILYDRPPLYMDCDYGRKLIREHAESDDWEGKWLSLNKIVLWSVYTSSRIRYNLLRVIEDHTSRSTFGKVALELKFNVLQRAVTNFLKEEMTNEPVAIEYLRTLHKTGDLLQPFSHKFAVKWSKFEGSFREEFERFPRLSQEVGTARESLTMVTQQRARWLKDYESEKHVDRDWKPPSYALKVLSRDVLVGAMTTDARFVMRIVSMMLYLRMRKYGPGGPFVPGRVVPMPVSLMLFPQYLSTKEYVFDITRLMYPEWERILGSNLKSFLVSQVGGINMAKNHDMGIVGMQSSRKRRAHSATVWMLKNLLLYSLLRSPFAWKRIVDPEMSKFSFPRAEQIVPVVNVRSVYEAWASGLSASLLNKMNEVLDDADNLDVNFDDLQRTLGCYNEFRKNMNDLMSKLDSHFYTESRGNTKTVTNVWPNDGHLRVTNLTPYDMLKLFQRVVNQNLLHSSSGDNKWNQFVDESVEIDSLLYFRSKLKDYKDSKVLSDKYCDFLNLVSWCKTLPLSQMLYLKFVRELSGLRARKDWFREQSLLRSTGMEDQDFARVWLMINGTKCEWLEDLFGKRNLTDVQFHSANQFMSSFVRCYVRNNHIIYRPNTEDVAYRNIDKRTFLLRNYFLGKLVRLKLQDFLRLGRDAAEQFERIPEWNDDLVRETFGHITNGSRIKVVCRTARSSFLYQELSGVAFGHFLQSKELIGTIEQLGRQSANMLTSKSFTYKSLVRLYNSRESSKLMKAIYTIYDEYESLRSMKEVKCDRARPLKYLIPLLKRFVKYYLPYEFEGLTAYINVRRKPPLNVRNVRPSVMAQHVSAADATIRRAVVELYAVVKENFRENFVLTSYLYARLFSFLTGTQWSDDEMKSVALPKYRSTLSGMPLQLAEIAIGRLVSERNYRTYSGTLRGVPRSLPYGFFHAMTDIAIPKIHELLVKYKHYEKYLQMHSDSECGVQSLFYNIAIKRGSRV